MSTKKSRMYTKLCRKKRLYTEKEDAAIIARIQHNPRKLAQHMRTREKIILWQRRKVGVCEACHIHFGYKQITAHHKDQNIKNNDATNIQLLCKACHTECHRRAQKSGVFPAGEYILC